MLSQVTEKDFYSILFGLLGRKFEYKGKEYLFVKLKPAPVGRYSIFTDSYTLSFYCDATQAFLDELKEIELTSEEKTTTKVVKMQPQQKINHDTIMEIRQTTDYELFGTITGNRKINGRKIEKISHDVNNGLNMLPYYPIIVSRNEDKMMVIDGQHRLEVSKCTQNPVYYVECAELNLKQIAQINSRGEKWKPLDFLNCYINLGIEDYKHLRRIMHEFGAPIKVSTLLLMNYQTEGKGIEDFQSGDFKCVFLDKTQDLLSLVKDLFGEYSFCMDRNLIKAVKQIKEKGLCDFARLKSKLESKPEMMEKQADGKKYIILLEQIYNLHKQNRDIIF